jgi:anthranilate phosphoribosyltransferase
VRPAQPEDLRGGDPMENLRIANQVLAGEPGPKREIVLVNAAAALVAAGKAETFLEGMALAVMSLDTGAARRKVAELAAFNG